MMGWFKKKIPKHTMAASELAARMLAKKIPLPTEYRDGKRFVAWHVAVPQIDNETRLLAAGLQFLIAEGYELTNDEDETLAMARAITLWWHGVTEEDVDQGE
jgi:hypothetical protein